MPGIYTASPPDVEQRNSKARTLQAIGIAGIALSVVAGVIAWILVNGVFGSVADSLEVTDDALTAADESIEAASAALDSATGSLAAVESASGRLDDALADTASVLNQADVVLAETVPANIDSIRRSFPGMIRAAQVLGDVLEGLSVIGVQFNPEPPIDQSLREIDRRLGELASTLREPDTRLSSVAADFDEIGEDIEVLRGRLGDLVSSLERSENVLSSYEKNTGNASAVVARARENLDGQRTLAGVLVLIGTAVLILTHISALLLGRKLPVGTASTEEADG